MLRKRQQFRGRVRHSGRNPLVFSRTSAVTPEKKGPQVAKPLIFILFILFLYIVFYSPAFKIKDVEIIGAEEKKEKVSEAFKKVRGKAIFKENLLFFSKSSLEEELLLTKEVKDIRVTKNYLKKKLTIEAMPLTPIAVWTERGKKFFLDENGFLFREIGEGEGGELVKINNNLINIVSETNSKPLGDKELIFVKEIINNFETLISEKIFAVSFENSFNEITLFTDKYRIYFDTKRSAEAQINNIIAVKKEADKAKKKIDYIDLRIENKIFYKFK